MTDEYKLISKKLHNLFNNLPVDIAYLYGSRVSNTIDKFSDFDIGVIFEEKLSKKAGFKLQLQLFSDISKILRVSTDQVDVVDIIGVPVLLQFNIISGKIIYCKNINRKIMVESKIMADYHDYHYYLDLYLRRTLDKIRKGVYFDRYIPHRRCVHASRN